MHLPYEKEGGHSKIGKVGFCNFGHRNERDRTRRTNELFNSRYLVRQKEN